MICIILFRNWFHCWVHSFPFRTEPSLLIFGPVSATHVPRAILNCIPWLLFTLTTLKGLLNLPFCRLPQITIYNNQFMRANALKKRLEDPCMFTSIFVSKFLTLLLFLLRHPPVPKQRTKHLVTDALVLPCQLLLLPATIWCYQAARATERDRSVSDPLPASVTTELAFGQASIQV